MRASSQRDLKEAEGTEVAFRPCMTKTRMHLVTAGFVVMSLVAGVGARAAQTQTPPSHNHGDAQPAAAPAPAPNEDAMRAAAARLDTLVAAMNAAPKDAQLAALIVVVNELVAQHKAMHAQMMAPAKPMGMMRGRGAAPR